MLSTHSRIAPPTISMKQTTQTLNSMPLMKLCPAAPMIAAGRNAISTPMTKRRAEGSLNMPIAIRHSRPK